MTTIRRYAGTRLYDPDTGRYVTPEQLRTWTVPFLVVDAQTGEDVTREVLATP